VGTLGAFVVDHQGVKVQVGSGLSDEIRSEIWDNKEKYIGRTIEIRYQEITPDGSLRFPTFVCFRNDRD
jgi:ATP-dependent DNA ligase